MRRPTLPLHFSEGSNASKLAPSVSAYSASNSDSGHSFRQASQQLGLNEQEGNTFGPRAKLPNVSGNADSAQQFAQSAERRGNLR